MRNDTWEKLEQMFESAPMMKAEPVPYAEIDEAATEAGINFPEDYRELLERAAAGLAKYGNGYG